MDTLASEIGRSFVCGKQTLKIGSQGIQVWEGQKPTLSLLWQHLDGWDYDGKKLSIQQVPSGKRKKAQMHRFATADGLAVITEINAQVKLVKRAMKKEKKAKKEAAAAEPKPPQSESVPEEDELEAIAAELNASAAEEGDELEAMAAELNASDDAID